MSDSSALKRSFERTRRLLTIKPEKGRYTTATRVRLRNTTTCDVEHKNWKFTADVGADQGGNDAGPGPSVLQRGALGSCLAIGYATWAAVLDVTINDLEVIVEADVDARGTYGIDNTNAGYEALRYKVIVDSPDATDKVMEMIKTADSHSPVLMDFKKPLSVGREVELNKVRVVESQP